MPLSFNSARAVRFDLSRGAVRAGRGDDRVLLLPVAALAELARSAPPDAVTALGRALGGAIGRRAAARIPDPASITLEDFITELAGEAALAGMGAWSLERWGRALVVVLQEAPPIDAMLAPLVGSAIEAASGRKVGCGWVSNDGDIARVLVSSDRAVERMKQWIATGVPWGQAMAKLHGAES